MTPAPEVAAARPWRAHAKAADHHASRDFPTRREAEAWAEAMRFNGWTVRVYQLEAVPA